MPWRLSEAVSPYDTLKVDGPLAMTLGTGPDVREAVAAFLEKRPPAFRGKVSTDTGGLSVVVAPRRRRGAPYVNFGRTVGKEHLVNGEQTKYT